MPSTKWIGDTHERDGSLELAVEPVVIRGEVTAVRVLEYKKILREKGSVQCVTPGGPEYKYLGE